MAITEQIKRSNKEMDKAIHSRADLSNFIRELREDLLVNGENWENVTLESYLEAMSAWIDDMDGYYVNRGEQAPELPSWKTFGDILMAAKTYE